MRGALVSSALGSVASLSVTAPLVSVGIPTFNRPNGLRRTLQHICDQTYRNIEIIVSDNASPGPATKEVVEEFASRDSRIKYFQQPKNIGANDNFRFVLRQASGDYFMWAADDDEWSPLFVESCLAAIDSTCSVMTGFNTLFRTTGVVNEGVLPKLRDDKSSFENAREFILNMQPSMFYGLHPRKKIEFFLTDHMFDFYDCYFVLCRILEGQYRLVHAPLYTAGVDAEKYEIKTMGPKLAFSPFLFRSAAAIAKSDRLSFTEKAELLVRLVRLVAVLRRHHRGV